MPFPFRKQVWCAIAVFCAFSATHRLAGQPAGTPPASSADVYLNDSFEINDKIAQAKSLAERGKWAQAAELLQSASDEAADKLVRIGPKSYRGVRDHVTRTMAQWPAVGIALYRERFEPVFANKLAELKDVTTWSPLLELFERYFCTAGAGRLTDVIAQLALESGNVALARRVYQQVLDRHPDRPDLERRCVAMLQLISWMEGAPTAPADDSLGTIRWMGQERTQTELAAIVPQHFSDLITTESPTEWSTLGGRPTRTRTADAAVDELGLLWRTPSPSARVSAGEAGDAAARARNQARLLSAQPVVAGSYVYVQYGREIVALQRNTGALAWTFQADETAPAAKSDADDVQPNLDSPSVHDGRLYAAIGVNGGPYYTSEGPARLSEVVCLDVQTGRVLWRTGELLRSSRTYESSFDPAPAVVNGGVYLTARRRRSFGFEDCYLYALDAATGELRFRTHLGSASTGSFGARTATMSIVAASGDRIFVCTNLGAIAAVSASSGEVLWMRVYDRDSNDAAAGANWSSRERFPWEVNPVLASRDRVICAPSDSSSLWILSADDGEILQRHSLADLANLRSLIGVVDDVVFAAGDRAVAFDLALGAPLWTADLSDDGVFGRPVLTKSALVLPLRDRVVLLATNDGTRKDLPWPDESDAGNIIPVRDQLFAAGPKSIACFVRKSDLFASLRSRMNAAPTEALPALELAEIALRSGETAEAVTALDEAVRRAGGFAAIDDPSLRRRFFESLLVFVDVLSSKKALDPPLLEKLSNYLSECPPDRAAHVTWRLRMASILEDRGDATQSVALYQQILRDRSLREVEIPQLGARPESAASVARRHIARVLEKNDRSIYAAFDAEARRMLDNGRSSRDSMTLLRVAEVFPNSEAAAPALFTHAEILRASGAHEEAARWFVKIYHQYPKIPDRATLMKHVADAFEQSGRPEHAYRWLTKASREFPAHRFDEAGRAVTFLEYREHLADVRAKLEPSRAKASPPLDKRVELNLRQPATLLPPRFASSPDSHWSKVYVQTGEGIMAFDSRLTIALWNQPTEARDNSELLIATRSVAVFADKYEVYALDPANGAKKWSYGSFPAGAKDPAANWEDVPGVRLHAISGKKLVHIRDDGAMTCMDYESGDVLWTMIHRPVASGRLCFADPWVAYHVVKDDRVVLCLVDAATGRWHDAILTEESQTVEEIFLTLDGQLILASPHAMTSFDLETKTVRWRATWGGRLRRDSLEFDMDAAYFTDDGIHVTKISLEDGAVLWQSDRITVGREDDFSIERLGRNLIISTSSVVASLDAANGQSLWQGSLPKETRFIRRFVTEDFVIALHDPPAEQAADSVVYFYDHRNASGVLPRVGGVLPLGDLGEIRNVLPSDGAIWIQTHNATLAFTATHANP